MTTIICTLCERFESKYERDCFSSAPCGHLFHRGCVTMWVVQTGGKASCPTCRAQVALNGLPNVQDIAPQLPRRDYPKSERPSRTLKIVVLGDSGTGKSCLTSCYSDGVFLQGPKSTILIDYRDKIIEIGGHNVRLRLWDTGGTERFNSITTSYIRGAHAALVVYDITNRESFLNLNKWVDFCREAAQTVPIILICGNKADLKEKREVSEYEGQICAVALNAEFMEASAKDGVNVHKIFRHLATLSLDELDKFEDISINHSNELTLKLPTQTQGPKKSKKSKCC